MSWNRREVLGWGVGAAAAAAFATRAQGLNAPGRSETIDELVAWILATPREEAVRRAARELHAGLEPRLLLGALLVGAARAIHPDLPRFNHAALVVASLDELARDASAAQCARLVLWGLDNLKSSQERQQDDGAWKWSSLDARKVPEGEQALAALAQAFDAWDQPAADAALVGAVRSVPAPRLGALLAEYGMRCRANIGHKAIYTAQSRRALPLAGPAQREGVLRSLVRTFFIDPKSPEAEVFEQSRKLALAASAPKAPKERDDLRPARELLAEIRKADGHTLPATVARLLQDGAHPDALWDAVFVGASEVTLRHVSIATLHTFTSSEALHHLAKDCGDERLARLALMQAASWVGFFRGGMAIRGTTEDLAFQLGALGPEDSTRLEPGSHWGPLGRPKDELAIEKWREGALHVIRTKGNEVHEFKLTAAALIASREVTSVARPAVLEALASHLPEPDRQDSPELLRIDKAIADAG